jgi:hypothetical protein
LEGVEQVGQLLGDAVLSSDPARGRRAVRAARVPVNDLPEVRLRVFEGALLRFKGTKRSGFQIGRA